MNTAIERLLTLHVRDVMNPNVVEVRASQTMAEAAAVLAAHHISGAPVVDEQGRCVGVLSAADFVHRENRQNVCCEPCLAGREHVLAHERAEEPVAIEAPDEEGVRRHMTSAVQTIAADASMMEAARILCAQHVHRLPVVDERSRVVGMVTSLDLIAATVKAVEEWLSAGCPEHGKASSAGKLERAKR
jgi:CBS-domain-containing membrane protein